MSVVQTLIGNIKGPQGETGATGATGAAGAAATVNVGTVSTTAYGNPAQVTNSGTESAAVLDFVIPQGAPGEEVTDLSNLSIGSITTQTAQYPTPQIGDTGATLVGKIIKYFSDLRTLIGTKLNTANVVNNFTTNESGYALDARAGKTLNDSLSSIFTVYTVTVTPSASGNASLGDLIGGSLDKTPIFAYAIGNQTTPVIVLTLRYSSTWFVHLQLADGTAVTTSTEIRIVTVKAGI